ncbi:hypothetical protein HH310_42525 [Actinoplanes sp. TBRC 11911]|uniref:HEPN domain-containing protein n=1 Tax=Actinoplanes sp. TBRC 11911 TaxID=2729386 RepID=UPI00145D957B|nr:HEPN domain-containing protein [Actinoplanes sp. TBRC 11911]NMO57827.1 hypothetical protein [Actinoplanes sp. TBRC 11911]
MNAETGLFWLPDTPETKVPGRLVAGQDGSAALELIGAITPDLVESYDPGTNVTTSVPAPEQFNLLIHGFLSDVPRAVTLIDCFPAGRTRTSHQIATIRTQTLRPRLLMRGALVAGDAARFTGVRLRTAGFNTWAGMPRVDTSSPGDGSFELKVPPLEAADVPTGKGVRLTLVEEAATRQQANGDLGVTRRAWIQLTDIEAATFRSISAEYVTALVGYLSFARGASIPLTGLQVLYDGKWLSVTFQGMESGNDDTAARHDVLLPLRVTGLQAVGNFVDVYRTVGPAVPITQDALSNQRRATLDTQVLELTTVAEGLHRDLYPTQERIPKQEAKRIRALVADALKDETNPRYKEIVIGTVLGFLEEPNYKSRLKQLIDEVADAMPGLCGNQDEWIKRAAEARNSYAHRKRGFIDESKIDEMYVISQALKWLFWAVILLKSDVPPHTLRERITQHQPYQHLLAHAGQAVPAIYS